MRQAVAGLKALAPDYLVLAHCAGERFYDMAREEMPGRGCNNLLGQVLRVLKSEARIAA